MHLASGDVEVAFYQYSIPKWLRRHFTLPPTRWKFLPARLRERVRNHEVDGSYHFAVRVLPMGWSWSVFLMQTVHVHMVNHLSKLPWVVDKSPCAAFGAGSADSGVRMLYIDNFAVLGS